MEASIDCCICYESAELSVMFALPAFALFTLCLASKRHVKPYIDQTDCEISRLSLYVRSSTHAVLFITTSCRCSDSNEIYIYIFIVFIRALPSLTLSRMYIYSRLYMYCRFLLLTDIKKQSVNNRVRIYYV